MMASGVCNRRGKNLRTVWESKPVGYDSNNMKKGNDSVDTDM
jgi:hypothetical protein